MQHRRVITTAATASALAALVTSSSGLAGSAAAAGHRHLRSGQRIRVGRTTCAPRWHAPNPGRAHFVVRNASSRDATISFFNSISDHIVGQIHDLAPGKRAALVVTAKPGTIYSWGCDLHGGTRHVSEAEKVPRHAVKGGQGHYVPPVDSEQLRQPIRLYRIYVADQLASLVPQAQTLVDAIDAHDLAAAKAAWLAARRTYLEIGQDNDAYGAFGNLGAKIDGVAAGLNKGTADPKFTGFHKVELDLWGTEDLTAAASDVAVLNTAVNKLANTPLQPLLPGNKTGELDWTLRSHEVLEDAVRDTLSGNDDYGSGTSLASVTADVSATKQLVVLLSAVITPRSPHLVKRAMQQLHHLNVIVKATRVGGQWVALSALTTTQRNAVNAAAGAAVETLAPIPDLLRIGNS